VPYHEKEWLYQTAGQLGFDLEGYLEKCQPYLTENQITEMIRDGYTIGGHSVDHPQYSLLPDDEVVNQTFKSVRFIKDTFSVDYSVFAFPYGDDRISLESLNKIFNSGEVDFCFGIRGLRKDVHPKIVHRVSFENPVYSAEEVVNFHSLKYLLNHRIGSRQ
jgi:peptidoglycan/xylan/chitin deacetylase (PgdA/CDA1 family)